MSEPLMSVAGQLVGIPAEKYSGINGITVDQNNKTIGLDETVLWEGTWTGGTSSTLTLSEPLSNFELVRIDWCPYTEPANWLTPKDSVLTKVFDNQIHLTGIGLSTSLTYQMLVNIFLAVNSNVISESYVSSVTLHSGAANENLRGYQIYKIVGINRISGGNA